MYKVKKVGDCILKLKDSHGVAMSRLVPSTYYSNYSIWRGYSSLDLGCSTIPPTIFSISLIYIVVYIINYFRSPSSNLVETHFMFLSLTILCTILPKSLILALANSPDLLNIWNSLNHPSLLPSILISFHNFSLFLVQPYLINPQLIYNRFSLHDSLIPFTTFLFPLHVHKFLGIHDFLAPFFLATS